jgi:hypothetical protein
VDDLITSKEFAKKIGKSSSYVCRLARIAKEKGYPWPIKIVDKKTLPWEAPEEEWTNILILFGQKRNEKKQKIKPLPISNQKLFSVTDAVEEIQKKLNETISVTWLYKLGKRNNQLGGEWPKRKGQARVAPIEEWIKIMKDKRLRAWSRKK